MSKWSIENIKRRIWMRLEGKMRNTPYYYYIYRAFWNYKFSSKKDVLLKEEDFFLTGIPSPGAGIGHQMANWISGLWWAKSFEVNYAYSAFSNSTWDSFLGFGHNQETVESLKNKGYKARRIPNFDENDSEIELIKNILKSYSGKKVVFLCEYNQFYMNQYGVIEDIKEMFYNAPAREKDQLVYDSNNFNIAFHVRRGDIMLDPSHPNLAMRYIANDYFEKVLDNTLKEVKTDKPIHIYFFSQGKESDFGEFAKYNNLHWCLDMNAQQSFLHMVYADALIISKSSFSYKPALLNNGIKVCPEKFWHGYPDDASWILADNNGDFVNQ